MNRPIFIKLGGSILTDKNAPEALAPAALGEVCAMLAAYRRDHPADPLLLGHGGGSFGHYWAERYGTARGAASPDDWWGVARVADAMARLNRAVVGALLEAGIPAVGVQPMASALAAAGRIEQLGSAQVGLLLRHGLLPVVYGDVLLDSVQGCMIASTETIFAALTPALQPRSMILVGEEAVFDADPRANPQARPIPLIDRGNYAAVLERLGGSHGVDVTGGMQSKVKAMWQLASAAPDLDIIICGPGSLPAALRGDLLPNGTTISNR